MPEQLPRIELEPDEEFDVGQGIPEDKPGPLQSAEEVAQEREATPSGAGKEERRTAGGIDPPLHRADLQTGIKLSIDAKQLFLFFQIGHTGCQGFIPHDSSLRLPVNHSPLYYDALPEPSTGNPPAPH